MHNIIIMALLFATQTLYLSFTDQIIHSQAKERASLALLIWLVCASVCV